MSKDIQWHPIEGIRRAEHTPDAIIKNKEVISTADIVLLGQGTNDLRDGAAGTKVAQFLSHASTLVERQGIHPMILEIPPQPYNSQADYQVKVTNNEVKETFHLHLLETSPELKRHAEVDIVRADGYHLSYVGAKATARAIRQKVEEQLKTSVTTNRQSKQQPEQQPDQHQDSPKTNRV